MYALDTNTLIYFFKGMGDVASHLLATPPKEIGIPTVVLFELSTGIAKSTSPRKRREQLDHLTSLTHTLPFGKAEADAAAQIRAQLERRGELIGPYDILIAATAIAHKATLVTHNTQEFRRVRHLSCADWY